MGKHFDVIVIGVGSMGSSACYYLAERGNNVLGLEQFTISHEFGSHAGQSRIIRKAYFEGPDYVPLLNRAYENWKTLEQKTGTQIYFRTGLLYFGEPDHPLILGVKQSASLYKIQVDEIGAAETDRRFPQFKLPPRFETLFEPDAGFLTPEKAIRVFTGEAERMGATIHTNEGVVNWKQNASGITVTTDRNTYESDMLIITAGAWTGKLIPMLGSRLRVTRQFIAWVQPRIEQTRYDFRLDHFPCWLLADPGKPGCYYGFPLLAENEFGPPAGLKLAHHFPALPTDPDNVNRQLEADDEKDLAYLINTYFNTGFDLQSCKFCLYANSPDENFIIDKLPGCDDRVIIACGFSGHGFKFVPVVGEILADLATKGTTKMPIDFLNIGRVLD